MSVVDQDQDSNLSLARRNMRSASAYLRKAIIEDDMKEALRQAAGLLAELRTGALGPQKYYELYMQASDEMSRLESFFSEEHSKGRSYADLYELVQNAGNVLPRLYMLCTVGSCYIRSGEAPAKDILRDLVEMCKGVQHPTRGLFLRAYLVQVCRGLLPDTGSRYEGPEGGDVVDAVDFLLCNFTEMNKLWVRMSHQGGPREREKRERERAQLSDLVGKNLTSLSQLDGLSFALYKDVVLPRVMEQIVSCRDELAQQYLMQCCIAAFPDDFHMGTLDILLGALPELQPGVKLAGIMGSLLDRLASYASSNPAVVESLTHVDAFGRMSDVAAKTLSQHPDLPGSELAAMYAALLAFVGVVYPERLDFVDSVLKTCQEALAARGSIEDPKTERQIMTLLTTPLEKYTVITVLGLEHYHAVLSLLQPTRQRDMARRIAETVLSGGNSIGSAEKVEVLLTFLSPLISDVVVDLDEEDVEEDASLVARMMHMLKCTRKDKESGDVYDKQYEIVEVLLEHVMRSGRVRMKHLLPPLCFMVLEGVQGVAAATPDMTQRKTFCERWYRFLHKAATALADVPAAQLALEIFLSGATSASEEGHMDLMAYEFYEQAFILYEESIPDTRDQLRALHTIIGSLHKLRVFHNDSRSALVQKAGAYCAKLLKKSDQCRAVLACTHLYWQQYEEQQGNKGQEKSAVVDTDDKDDTRVDFDQQEQRGQQPPVRDAAGVLSTLKRALKIAAAVQQQLSIVSRKDESLSIPGHLYLEILNKYLYFYEAGCSTITPAVLQSMLDLVRNEVSSEECAGDEGLQRYYKNTMDHVKQKKGGGDAEAAQYDTLQI